RNILIALDPVTGDERWRFDPEVPDQAIPYTAACRGVAYYDGRLAPASTPVPADTGVSTLPEAGDTAAAPQDPMTADAAAATAEAAEQPGVSTRQPGAPLADSAPCATRIIEGTLDARLVAVDARTGKPCADFG